MKKTDILKLNQYEGQDMVSRAGFNQDNQALETTVGGHLRSKANPHGVTAAQAGADPKGSAQKVQEGLNTHQQRKDNPHGVTAAQAGALPITGGTVKGNVVANWFQTTAISRLSSVPERYPVLDPNGWIYFRNKADMAGDLGIMRREVLCDKEIGGINLDAAQAVTLNHNMSEYDMLLFTLWGDRTAELMTGPNDAYSDVLAFNQKSGRCDGGIFIKQLDGTFMSVHAYARTPSERDSFKFNRSVIYCHASGGGTYSVHVVVTGYKFVG